MLLATVSLLACNEPLPAPVEVGPYTVDAIEKGVYHIEDCNSARPAGYYTNAEGQFVQNNCSDMYLIVGKKSALLIDLSNRLADEEALAEYRSGLEKSNVRKKSLRKRKHRSKRRTAAATDIVSE